MAEHSSSPKQYLIVWLWLFVLTALEVGVATAPGVGRGLLVVSLLVMAAAKAALVGLYFMHLRFERPLLGVAITSTLLLASIYVTAATSDAPFASGW
jgi:cytochrome c oxidase subunit 4